MNLLVQGAAAIIKSMSMTRKQTGFTIVELLIVIVIIGILSTIVIVAYNGIQSRARDTARSSDVASIDKSYEMYRITNGSFPKTYAIATSDAVISQGLAAKMIAMSGTAQSPCPTTPKTKICVYAYGNSTYSEYALVYWKYTANHWINVVEGIGQSDSDRWHVETNYGSGEYPIKP